MDSLSCKIDFDYSKIRSDVDDPTEKWQLLLHVNAIFSIEIRGDVFFYEPDFPVLEFAVQAKKWITSGGDFDYISMEADENPMISLKEISKESLLISAVGSKFKIDKPLDTGIVRHGLKSFIARLCVDVRDNIGLNIDLILGLR